MPTASIDPNLLSPAPRAVSRVPYSWADQHHLMQSTENPVQPHASANFFTDTTNPSIPRNGFTNDVANRSPAYSLATLSSSVSPVNGFAIASQHHQLPVSAVNSSPPVDSFLHHSPHQQRLMSNPHQEQRQQQQQRRHHRPLSHILNPESRPASAGADAPHYAFHPPCNNADDSAVRLDQSGSDRALPNLTHMFMPPLQSPLDRINSQSYYDIMHAYLPAPVLRPLNLPASTGASRVPDIDALLNLEERSSEPSGSSRESDPSSIPPSPVLGGTFHIY